MGETARQDQGEMMAKIIITNKQRPSDTGVLDLSKAALVWNEQDDKSKQGALCVEVPGVGTLRYSETKYKFDYVEETMDGAIHLITKTVLEIVAIAARP
jgi:hypothetical protein